MRKINTYDYYSNEDDNEKENSTEQNNDDEFTISAKDLRDIDILTTQSNAQLVLALGYFLEYKASMQALELINLKYLKKQFDVEENDEDDISEEEAEDIWKSRGVDSDKTALLAAELELYGQTILTRLDFIKLQYLNDNFNEKDFTIVKSANIDIYIGAMLEEIAYMFNLEGAKKLFAVSNSDGNVNSTVFDEVDE